jgi:MerR family transcriptional regulator/heat shock protein HspR
MVKKAPDFYLISVAAQMLNMHPQTLRKYERLGLVRPHRTTGSMRVYTQEELARLRMIKSLVEDAGINLAGVHRLLEISEVALRLRPLVSGRPEKRVRAGDRRADLEREWSDLLRLLGLDPEEKD